MPEPHASLQRKLLSSEGIALKGLTIDMKVYGWLPKRKPRNNLANQQSSPRASPTAIIRPNYAPDTRV